MNKPDVLNLVEQQKQRRLEFQQILQDLCDLDETHVHYQPPPDVRLDYPCVIYNKSQTPHFRRKANNELYTIEIAYTVVAIDPDPDGGLDTRLMTLPNSLPDRSFRTDGLNHHYFTIYY